MLVVIGLMATACGSDDVEPAADAAEQEGDGNDVPTTDEPTDEPDDEPVDGANDSETPIDESDVEGDDAVTPPPDAEDIDEPDESDDRRRIDDFDDIPRECVDLIAEFLRAIEPTVSPIDWESATMSELEALSTTIDDSSTDFDVESEAAGCNDFVLGDDDERSIEFVIVVAEREAPGTVGYLEFLDDFLNSTGVAESEASVLPEDCDGVIAYVKDLIAGVESPEDVPVSVFADIMSAISAIQTTCTPDEITAFATDPEIEAFLSNL
jgi:hypothetical protein